MKSQIENSEAYKKLQPFQQSLIAKRENRLKIENAVITARAIGYDNWADGTKDMSTNWKAIVKEILDTEVLQTCESCELKFKIETMATDADSNYFCPECWKELAPIMQKEYEELVAKGEIEPYND